MASINLDTLSPFGRMAVKLDVDFCELMRLSGQIEKLEINSDSSLDRAVKLLDQFAHHGQNIAEGITEFSRILQDARDRSEAAAKLVAERAPMVQERRQQQNLVQEKLLQLEQQVKEVNASFTGFKNRGQIGSAQEEKGHLRTELERMNSHLADFIESAQAIKAEAGQSRFKSLERDADSLLTTLHSARRKLTTALSAK
jgi:hypothetical protein